MNDKKIDCCKCKEKDLKEDNQHLPLYLPIGWSGEDYVICNKCYDKLQSE